MQWSLSEGAQFQETIRAQTRGCEYVCWLGRKRLVSVTSTGAILITREEDAFWLPFFCIANLHLAYVAEV